MNYKTNLLAEYKKQDGDESSSSSHPSSPASSSSGAESDQDGVQNDQMVKLSYRVISY